MAYDEYFERPLEIVQDQINQMSGRANDALDAAKIAVAALSNLPDPQAGIAPAPGFAMPTDGSDELPLPNPPKFDEAFVLDSLVIPPVDNGQALLGVLSDGDDVPTFTPPVTVFNIPAAPAPIDLSGIPTAPVLGTVAIPDAPGLTDVELGNLLQIVIPTFEGLNLPTFTAVPPEFTKIEPSGLAWGDITYSSSSLDALKAKIATMLAGGTGIPASVEKALFERSADRVDVDAAAARAEAVDTWAARNFEMPPGMLIEQDNAAREAGQIQKNTNARDVLIQAATWEIENLRFAVTNGIALEGALIGLFTAMAERALNAAKARVDADVQIYNAGVALFQAEYAGYGIKAQVYEAEIRGELAKLEAFKAEIEAQQAIGQVNEQTVRIYIARLQGVTNMVELYRARVGGAQASIDAQRSQVQMYGEGVQAYAARVNADKVRFDAYTAQINGEVAKGTLVEALARAFSAEVDGYKAKADIRVSNVQARVAALNAATSRFTALVEAERAQVEANADAIRSRLAAFQAQVSLYTATTDVGIKQRQLDISKFEAALRNAIAYYEIVLKEYDAALARLEQESAVREHAFATVATVESQIAAGAMAATHVSAGMSGSAQAQSSVTQTTRFNEGPLP